MKPGEKGYTLIELLIAMTIMVMATGAAAAAIFQIFGRTELNSNHMTVVRQVENAGYWISRDAQMARVVTTTDNLTPPAFLSLSWTEWTDSGSQISHSANYTFEDLTDGVGKFKRIYASGGSSGQSVIAQYIYYNADDAANTSKVSYQNPVVTVKLTAIFGSIQETREYQVKRRPDL